MVKRELVEQMQDAFTKSDVRNLLQVEYCQKADTQEFGMTGTGLFIVNPPWQLLSQLNEILPYLKLKIGNSESQYSINQLIAE